MLWSPGHSCKIKPVCHSHSKLNQVEQEKIWPKHLLSTWLTICFITAVMGVVTKKFFRFQDLIGHIFCTVALLQHVKHWGKNSNNKFILQICLKHVYKTKLKKHTNMSKLSWFFFTNSSSKNLMVWPAASSWRECPLQQKMPPFWPRQL